MGYPNFGKSDHEKLEPDDWRSLGGVGLKRFRGQVAFADGLKLVEVSVCLRSLGLV